MQLWSGASTENQLITNYTDMFKLSQEFNDNEYTYKYKMFNTQLVELECGGKIFTFEQYHKLKQAEDLITQQTEDLKLNIRNQIFSEEYNKLVKCTQKNIIYDAMS